MAKKEEKQAVVRVPNGETALAAASEAAGDAWGAEGIDNSDIVIPKLLLMQPLSVLVSEEKAKAGDIVRSTTGEVLKEAKIIPVMSFKTWILKEKVNGKMEFRGTVPLTAANADAELTWKENGTDWERDRALNFYVLIASDVEKDIAARKALEETGELPEGEAALIPHLLSFRRTGYKTGKKLITHFARMATIKLPAAVSMFTLGYTKEKNDKGTYYVFALEPGGKTLVPHLEAAKRWYDTLRVAKVRVHEEGEDVTDVNAGSATPEQAVGEEKF